MQLALINGRIYLFSRLMKLEGEGGIQVKTKPNLSNPNKTMICFLIILDLGPVLPSLMQYLGRTCDQLWCLFQGSRHNGKEPNGGRGHAPPPPPTKIFNGFVTSVVVHLGIYNVGKRFIIQDFKQ